MDCPGPETVGEVLYDFSAPENSELVAAKRLMGRAVREVLTLPQSER